MKVLIVVCLVVLLACVHESTGSRYIQKYLSAHNSARAGERASPPLPTVSWDQELANKCVTNVGKCSMSHDTYAFRKTAKFPTVGQNLQSSGFKKTPEGYIQAAVDGWMGEKKYWNFAGKYCSGVCGHYTQVVWRDSTKIGCAMKLDCGNSYIYVCCNYGPGGNWPGKSPY